jgi:chemotaxis protein CheD
MNERRNNGVSLNGTLIKPGSIYITDEPQVLFSIVGSSVTVCLWDEKTHISGMNCFVEPVTYDKKKTTARFGNVSMIALINSLKGISPRSKFEAHIFGGASNTRSEKGEKNIEIARKILHARKIPIVSEDVGGTKGRKIAFDTESGQACVIKVHKLRKEDWH